MARHNPAELAVGAAVLLVAAGFLAFALTNTGRLKGGGGTTLHADFDHVDGISTGSDVRIAGVKVGSVVGLALDPKTYLAAVTFTVQSDIPLTTDSSATVATDGLLGSKYIAVATGGADEKLRDGGTITITQGSVNLEALLGKYIFPSVGSGGAAKTGAQTGAPAKQGGGDGIAPLK
jgi:phospholipid/cholesterol/gamma-HCH transport system substrate-binding protein